LTTRPAAGRVAPGATSVHRIEPGPGPGVAAPSPVLPGRLFRFRAFSSGAAAGPCDCRPVGGGLFTAQFLPTGPGLGPRGATAAARTEAALVAARPGL